MRKALLSFLLLSICYIAQAQLTVADGLNLPGYWDTPAKPNPPTNASLRMANPPGTSQMSDAPTCTVPYTGGTVDLYNNIYATQPLGSSMYRAYLGGTIPAATYNGGIGQGFYFTSGPCGAYGTLNWGGVNVIMNNVQNYILGSLTENSVTIASGKFYTVNFDNPAAVGTNPTNPAMFFETSSAPAEISSVSHAYSSSCNGANGLIVTVNTNIVPATEQKLFVRYTSSAFAASTYTPVVFADTANPTVGKAVIPFAASTTFDYYVMSSTVTQSGLQSTYSAGATVADIVTLTANNNGGANYNYTFPATATTQALSGHYYIDNTATTVYPNSFLFSSMASAVTALNTNGMCGSVVLNLPGGFSETAPAGGYNIDMTALNDTLEPALGRTLWIKKYDNNGALPVLQGFVGTQTANQTTWDGIFSLQGTDYTTIERIRFDDPASNTTNTMGMEYGLAFFKYATNGCKNNLVLACQFDLNNYDATSQFAATATSAYVNVAILGCNSSRSAASTNLTITTTGGRHENITIRSCLIENSANGIGWHGFSHTTSPYDMTDQNLTIGGPNVADGNTIRKFSFGGYSYVNANVFGIKVRNIQGITIKNNIVDNLAGGGAAHNSGAMRGIWTGGSTGPYNSNIVVKNNSVKLVANYNQPLSNGNIEGLRLESNGGLSNSDTFSYNTISNCAQQNTGTNWSGDFYGIFMDAPPMNMHCVGNEISNNSNAGTATTNNLFFGISYQGIPLTLTGAHTFDSNFIAGNTGNWRGMRLMQYTGGGALSNLYYRYNTIGTSAQGNSMNIVTSTANNICYGIAVSSSAADVTNLNMIGNKLVNFDMTGFNSTQSYTGILFAGTPASGLADLSNNVIRDLNLQSSNTVRMISAPTLAGHTVYVQNDSIISVNNSTTSDALSAIFTANASNQYINNNYIENVTQAAAALSSFNAVEQVGGTNLYCKNNYINNFGMTAIGSSTSSEIRGLSTSSGTISSIQNNVIKNLNVYGTTAPVISAIRKSGAATSDTVASNRIEGIYQQSAASGASAVYGIYLAGGNSTTVYGNSISDLSGNGTSATASSTGIYISGTAGTNPSFYNNFIQRIFAPASTNNNAVIGINGVSTAATFRIYNNTIALGFGSAIGGGINFGAAGIYYNNAVSGSYDLRNNIIYINGTPSGTGIVSAIRRQSGTANVVAANFNTSSNNNLLYAPAATNCYLYNEGSTTASVVNGFTTNPAFVDVPASNLYYDPSFNTACSKYKLFFTPRESSSATEDISLRFTGGSVYPDNLQLTAGTTYAESGGQVISAPAITLDYYGNIRSVSAPDLGAHEFSGTGIDAVGPTISFTNIPTQSCYTTGPTLTATITDISGIKIASGSRPRVWYKKKSESNVMPGTNTSASNGWKYVEASNTSSPFTFTLDYSLLTSAITGNDTIQYFVVASDSAAVSNVTTSTASFTSGCPSDVALTGVTFPVLSTPAIKFYRFLWNYSGTVQMNDASDWQGVAALTSFTNTNGLFDKINSGCLSGNLIVEVTGNFTSELSTVGLLEWTNGGCSAGTYSLTIQPSSGALRTISGNPTSTSNALIRIEGADDLTINGAFGVTMGLLKFEVTGTTNTQGAIALKSGSGINSVGCNNVSIMNCLIDGSGIVNNNSGIALCGTNVTTSGADNDNILIDGNVITSCDLGINIRGTAAALSGGCNDIVINNNTIGNTAFGNTSILQNGIEIRNAVNVSVTNNIIRYIGGNASAGDKIGIELQSTVTGTIDVSDNTITRIVSSTGFVNGIQVDGNAVTTGSHVKITGNFIGTLRSTATDKNSIGIQYSGVPAVTMQSRISLNDIANDTALAGLAVGIQLTGNQGSNSTAIDSNTVDYMIGDGAYGIRITGSNANSGFSRNVISNIINNYGKTAGLAYGIHTSATVTSALYSYNTISDVSAINNNAFGIYVSGTATNSYFHHNDIERIRNISFAGGNGGKGMYLNNLGAASNVEVANNTISGMDGDGWTLADALNFDANVGIWILGTSDQVYLYNNSVNLYGSSSGSVVKAKSACLATSGTVTNVTVRNNIFVNTFDNPSRTDDTAYIAFTNGAIVPYILSTHNDLYHPANTVTGTWWFGAVYAGPLFVIGFPDVASWQALGFDSFSHEVDPLFTTNDDLHARSCQLNMQGAVIGSVTDDMDGDPRDPSTPDIGADEYTLTFASFPNNVLSSASSTVNAQFECFTEDGWTHLYEDGLDNTRETSDDVVLLSLNRNGNPIGYVSSGLTASVSNTANYGSDGHTVWAPNAPYVTTVLGEWEVAGRWWDVVPLVQPTTDVSVRFYYDNTDFQDINDKLVTRGFTTLPGGHTDLRLYKMLGAVSPDPSSNHIGVNPTDVVIYDHSEPAEAGPDWVYTNLGTVHQAQFDVSSFSGGGLGGAPYGTSPLLPVELISLSATAVDNEFIRVNWSTAVEVNNAGFEVLRSRDGIRFEQIGWLDGMGSKNEISNYVYDDHSAEANVLYYYKLNQTDLNGDKHATHVVSAMISAQSVFNANLYPNPAQSQTLLELQLGEDAEVELNISNLMGEKMYSSRQSLKAGMNLMQINTESLPSGTYLVELKNKDSYLQKQLVVLH